MTRLPERDEDAEEAFVARFRRPDAETEELVAAVTAALDARRPQLAARLVCLLPEAVPIEPGSALERACRAARLVLQRPVSPADASWSELDDAWVEARKSRLLQITRRIRDQLAGHPTGPGAPRRGRRR